MVALQPGHWGPSDNDKGGAIVRSQLGAFLRSWWHFNIPRHPSRACCPSMKDQGRASPKLIDGIEGMPSMKDPKVRSERSKTSLSDSESARCPTRGWKYSLSTASGGNEKCAHDGQLRRFQVGPIEMTTSSHLPLLDHPHCVRLRPTSCKQGMSWEASPRSAMHCPPPERIQVLGLRASFPLYSVLINVLSKEGIEGNVGEPSGSRGSPPGLSGWGSLSRVVPLREGAVTNPPEELDCRTCPCEESTGGAAYTAFTAP